MKEDELFIKSVLHGIELYNKKRIIIKDVILTWIIVSGVCIVAIIGSFIF